MKIDLFNYEGGISLRRSLTAVLVVLAMFASLQAQNNCTPWSGNGPWNGNGRIAISSDGNEHDHDDWAATPLSLALLAAKGLQDQLVLYTYSDHVWGSNQEHSNATNQMNTSALEGKQEFGFNNTQFIEAVANKQAAYNAMADAINASSASNPLFILGAGPMHVIGEGMNRANANKLQFVTAISHSTWNENHSHNNSWTWAKMKNNFSAVNFVDIQDQNGGNGYDGLRAVISKFNWIKNSPARNNPLYKAGSWDWLYSRQETVKKKGGTEFDPSDAGMVVYLLTGIQKTNPSDAKNIMESPVAPCGSPTLDCAGVENGTAYIDDCGECVGGTTGKEPCVVGDCQDVTIQAINFNNINVNGFKPAYIDNNRQALAINAAQYKDEYAAARTPFTGQTATYDITITSMLETDGECTYKLRVGGALIGEFTNIPTNTDYTLYTHTFENVAVSNGAQIQVEFNSASNGQIPEGNGFAYARGRWTKIDFVCDGGSTLPKDCAGVEGGTAFIDDCGQCVGGTTGLEPCSPCTGDGYTDQNGLIIMEVENTTSALGKWKKVTDNPGYTGTAHLEFTGNGINGGPATSPLKYQFTVQEAGTYRLIIRARKRLQGAANDKCNDGYVKLQGDFTAGAGGAPLNTLTKNTKFFGGPANGWGWALKLDEGHTKYDALYKLKAGKTYTFTLSGRSIRWNIDRIVFFNTATSSISAAQNTNKGETKGDCADPIDCAGVENGTAYIDDCGECVGGTTGKEPCLPTDCAGVEGGSAIIVCGECVGGTTGKLPPDADGDGIVDCEDPCPNDANNLCGPSFPGRIEAEDFVNQQGVLVAPTTDVDGGEHIRQLTNGEFTEYDITVGTAGTYQFDVRYTNGITVTSDMDISMDGANVGNIQLPPTGAWGVWATASIDVDLQAGTQKLRLDFNNKSTFNYCYDINWFSATLTVDPCANNTAPTVTLTAPVSGTSVDETESISFEATAADAEGSVSVEFFANNASLGVDASAPYSVSAQLAAGSYTVVAVATDECGAITTSSASTLTVNAVDPCLNNTAPTVSVTAPAGGSSFIVGSSVALAASANDADGSVTQVEFFVDGSSVGVDASAPYTSSYTMTSGSHTITAVATDDCGASTTSASVSIDETTDPQQPFAANLVPGVIEAEEYDLGGQGIAYNDNDAANKGNANFRTNEGVDLDLRSGVISIGWCAAGEWTEYTLNVQQSGTYKLFYTFATNANNNPKSFSFAINGTSVGTVNIAGNDPINNSNNSVFATRELGEVTLAAGSNLLRWTAGSNAISFDKVEFEYQTPADVTAPTVPTLTINTVSETSADLSWTASTDSESGVAGYKVYQDGAEVANVAGLSTTISGLSCGSSYAFSVSAYDNAGNESAQSTAEIASTDACAGSDYIFIGHVASGKRLGASAANGVDTRPATNAGGNVQWEEVATDGGYFYLVNVGTGQKLNAPTKKTINMVAGSTTGNTAQWMWVAQGGGEYFLQSREWGKYFHIAADGVSDITTKWNTNLAGIVWTFTAIPKSAENAISSELTLEAYPNPASSSINVLLEGSSNAEYQIVSLTGSVVVNGNIYNGNATVDVSELSNGIYVLQVREGATIINRKINIKR